MLNHLFIRKKAKVFGAFAEVILRQDIFKLF